MYPTHSSYVDEKRREYFISTRKYTHYCNFNTGNLALHQMIHVQYIEDILPYSILEER